MLEKARLSRPNSSWVVEVVCNITFFINKLKDHPSSCGINLPDFIVNNTGLKALQKNKKTSKLYFDNLCIFWCLAHIGVARGGRGPGPPPIKIPPMIKNYDNIA